MAKVLAAEGVTFLSAFPMQNLIESGAKIGIRPVICRQERTGVNIADGYARVTNGAGLGVFTMQYGPGAENAFAGVAQAYADSVPMLHLAGGSPSARQGVAPTFDPVRAYRSVTKWAAQIRSAGDVPAMMRRALGQLRNGRRGPVLLEMMHEAMGQDYPGDSVDYTPVTGTLTFGAGSTTRTIAAPIAERSTSNATPFWRTTAVVGNWRDVSNRRNRKSGRLKSPQRRFAARSRTAYLNFEGLHPMLLRHLARRFCRHLGGIGR